MSTSAEAEDPQEYIMDRTASRRINEDTNHPAANIGAMSYRMRWYGFYHHNDTIKSIWHIRRSKFVSYYKRIKWSLSEIIKEAQIG